MIRMSFTHRPCARKYATGEVAYTRNPEIKQQFLTAPVFDGKTFWQVEKDLIWVEEGSPIQIKEV
jgi:hypothetical protein